MYTLVQLQVKKELETCLELLQHFQTSLFYDYLRTSTFVSGKILFFYLLFFIWNRVSKDFRQPRGFLSTKTPDTNCKINKHTFLKYNLPFIRVLTNVTLNMLLSHFCLCLQLFQKICWHFFAFWHRLASSEVKRKKITITRKWMYE